MIDLKFNYPIVGTEQGIMDAFFAYAQPKINTYLQFPPYQGIADHLNIAADYLQVTTPIANGKSTIVQTNSGNASLAIILQTLQPNHQHIIIEPYTYPTFIEQARCYGYTLHAAETDEQGITIDSIVALYKRTNASIIYVQPTIQNPTCTVMDTARREAIAAYAIAHDILLIEDDAYRFLHPNPLVRFVDVAPSQTFHVYSLAKPFNPFIKTAYIIAPKVYEAALVTAIRWFNSGPSTLMSALAVFLMQNGHLDALIRTKQQLASQKQQALQPYLKQLPHQTYPTSFHLWAALPKHIAPDVLMQQLAQQQVSIPNTLDMTVQHSSTTNHPYIRIALGIENDIAQLEKAMGILLAQLHSFEL
jgi:DNA-binding transcriptional MocR family regulator